MSIVVSVVTIFIMESTYSGFMVISLYSLLLVVSRYDRSLIKEFPLFVLFSKRARMYCRLRWANVFFSTVWYSVSCGGLNCMSFG